MILMLFMCLLVVSPGDEAVGYDAEIIDGRTDRMQSQTTSMCMCLKYTRPKDFIS